MTCPWLPQRIPPGIRRCCLLLVALAAACSSGTSESAVPGTPAPPAPQQAGVTASIAASAVDRVLAASDIEAIVDARARIFTRQVALLAGDLTDPELERLVAAVRTGFAPELLRRDIGDFLEAEAPPGRLDEVLDWLESGGSAEVRRTVDSYEPPLELEEWLTEYTADPPSAVRIRLVARWTDARGTGDFFVLLEQALSEAAYSVRSVFRPDAGGFRPLAGDALVVRLENSYNAAVVTALHATETVPDTLLTASTQEYESPSGVWYVQTYQLAVAEAMRAAGVRVVHALAG
jgi:hypothetical protein